MNISELKESFHDELKKADDVHALEALHVKYLGRKEGEVTTILRSLKAMPLAEKKEIGPAANALRDEIEKALKEKLAEFKKESAHTARIDITMPGTKVRAGHPHPLTKMEDAIKDVFRRLSFSVVEGPEVETEYYNFDVLNIPADHPARDMWDTFWLKQAERLFTRYDANITPSLKSATRKDQGRLLMRTHTSPMQIRYMKAHRPPFQIIVPGRVFRFEATDASHEINFHQVEGLMVGDDVTLANFKYVMQQFFHELFGKKTEVRFRPSYFPFVEPGLEVDVKLGGRWLEVMGAGMVHPNVLKGVGYDPKEVQGFAFGMGLERLAMIKYNIPDIRLFYSGDLRFINQF